LINQILLALCVGALLAGCGEAPAPAGRLRQPAGEFSYVTPAHWRRTRPAGMDFVIVATNAEAGLSANIFVEGPPRRGTVREQAARLLAVYRDRSRDYAVIRQQDFNTDSGLPGLKITACRRTKESLSLALYHYLLQDGDRVIRVTCSCAASVARKYEPVFDAAMKSLRAEP